MRRSSTSLPPGFDPSIPPPTYLTTPPPPMPGTETGTSADLTPRSRRENLVKTMRNFRYHKSEKPPTGSCSTELSSSTTPAYIKKMRLAYNTFQPRSSLGTHQTRSSRHPSPDGRYSAGNPRRDPTCGICYNDDKKSSYFHNHDSTQNQREFAKQQNKNADFFCTICKMMEPLKRPERRRILVSSSTLAGFW